MTEVDLNHKNRLAFGQKVPFAKTEGCTHLKWLGAMAGGVAIGAAGLAAQEATGNREIGMLTVDAMMGYYILAFLVEIGMGWRQRRERMKFAGRQLSYLNSKSLVKEIGPD